MVSIDYYLRQEIVKEEHMSKFMIYLINIKIYHDLKRLIGRNELRKMSQSII